MAVDRKQLIAMGAAAALLLLLAHRRCGSCQDRWRAWVDGSWNTVQRWIGGS